MTDRGSNTYNRTRAASPARRRVDDIFGHAKAELNISREVAATNEPINRKRGDIAQANLERKVLQSIDATLKYLEGAKA
jgi:hypothetical protein